MKHIEQLKPTTARKHRNNSTSRFCLLFLNLGQELGKEWRASSVSKRLHPHREIDLAAEKDSSTRALR
ncbi:hypothetical protein TNCV_324531 [Trichonephila clavipes]|nr:hypothetical protein TNCV_324531 [Trichonephila clavipes]